MSDQKVVTWEQYKKHISGKDCWVMVDKKVYNVSDYLVQHPGGDDILMKYAGNDATQRFNQVGHSQYAISLRNARLVGPIQNNPKPQGYDQQLEATKQRIKKQHQKKVKKFFRADIPWKEVRQHKSEESCWIVIDQKVYDVTSYLSSHPGGLQNIMEWAGKDCTKAFYGQNHSKDAQMIKDEYIIGTVQANANYLLYFLFAIIGIAIAVYFSGMGPGMLF